MKKLQKSKPKFLHVCFYFCFDIFYGAKIQNVQRIALWRTVQNTQPRYRKQATTPVDLWEETYVQQPIRA